MSAPDQATTLAHGPALGEDPVPEVAPRRHLGRWLGSVVTVAVVAVLLWSAASNPRFEWPVVARFLTARSILLGLALTLWLTAISLIAGFALGALVAMARLSSSPPLRALSWCYVGVFRSTPLLVQLLFCFNIGALYPTVFGVATANLIGPTQAAVIGLVLHETAHAAEVIRGGVLTVPTGQIEAAEALGMGRLRVLRRIVLPQAMRSIVPAAGNMLIGTLKGTAVVSVLAVQDLLYSAQVIYTRNYRIIPLLLVATLWYVAVTSVLSVGQHYLERHFGRGAAVRAR